VPSMLSTSASVCQEGGGQDRRDERWRRRPYPPLLDCGGLGRDWLRDLCGLVWGTLDHLMVYMIIYIDRSLASNPLSFPFNAHSHLSLVVPSLPPSLPPSCRFKFRLAGEGEILVLPHACRPSLPPFLPPSLPPVWMARKGWRRERVRIRAGV